MISLQEIKPRQIRALLLLLVLAPLIPTGLLLRFMFDTVAQEREAAREIISDAYQDTLAIALRSIADDLKKGKNFSSAHQSTEQTIAVALSRYFEPEVRVRIVNADHFVIAGADSVSGSPIVTAPVGELLPGSMVRLFLNDRSFVRDAVQEQIDAYSVTAVVVIVANMAIAGVAGWAFLRQIRNQELKSSTLATVAHELRTPVASMRLLLDTMREGRCPDQDEYLALISQENQRLAHLVDQFLTHSRLEQGTHGFAAKAVAPSVIANAAEENLRHRLQAENCRYLREMEPDLPDVFADRDSLICALTNLLDNALKYTGPEKVISLHVGPRDQGVEFAIRDNGIGIPTAEQKAIFSRFHQVDNRLARSGEGCGLGLSIVQRIIEIHRGRLSVESTPGAGSCFTFWIPAA